MGLVVILFFFGLAGGVVGRIKGSSFVVWFLVSAAVPFLGLLAAICYRWDTQELRRQCPGCGRILKLHDAVCMSCGTELDFPDVAVAPEAAVGPPRA
jgi:hypothetical protein